MQTNQINRHKQTTNKHKPTTNKHRTITNINKKQTNIEQLQTIFIATAAPDKKKQESTFQNDYITLFNNILIFEKGIKAVPGK